MSKKNIIIIFVAAFVALVGFTGLWFWRGRVERPVNFSDVKRPPAPEFNLKDYEGKEVKLSDFRGKPSVINVWAGWCPFCADELTDLVKLQEEFGDKIAVIGINRGETLEAAKQFSDKAGVIGKMILLLDPSDSFYSSIGGFSMPETIFTDASGFILFHKRGPMKLEEMKRRLQQAFNL